MKIGVYAGSFNPFHKGHLDILRQAEKLFDLVILAVGDNPEKVGNRREAIPKGITKHVIVYHGLLTDTLKEIANEWVADVTLIRGLRDGDDLSYERNQIAYMKDMMPGLNVVYFVCDKQYEHVSSRSLRDLRKFSEHEYKKYLPPEVQDNTLHEGFNH